MRQDKNVALLYRKARAALEKSSFLRMPCAILRADGMVVTEERLSLLQAGVGAPS